jgi:hypothetical protein
MKKLIGLVLAVVLLSPAMAFAGGATNAALGLGAFAVFNQILGGVGIFGGVPAVAAAPAYVAPAPVYVAPPPIYVAPAPVIVAPATVFVPRPVVVARPVVAPPVFVRPVRVYHRPVVHYAPAPYRAW